jgi:hypothetical protein
LALVAVELILCSKRISRRRCCTAQSCCCCARAFLKKSEQRKKNRILFLSQKNNVSRARTIVSRVFFLRESEIKKFRRNFCRRKFSFGAGEILHVQLSPDLPLASAAGEPKIFLKMLGAD